MTKSPFKQVQEFNRAFEVLPRFPDTYDTEIDDPYIFSKPRIFIDYPKVAKLRLDLITEEIGELRDAINADDMKEVRDAMADILYVVYGMADVFGVNMDTLYTQFNNMFIINHEPLNSLADHLAHIDASESRLKDDMDAFELKASMLDLFHIIIVVEQMYKFLGIDMYEDFRIIHNSNMSKLCNSEEEAIATVADYEAKYAAGTSPYDSPYYYEISWLGKWGVKNRSTGKVLKNINYIPVAFY